ncbi:DUF6461 domain-containing protein [Embleya hyalina]|uniref:Uncharacterized protein n=1 Tax=Embleya hyalina TaxID=516124 RepID=A0A401YT44_9ACTN|nr:DUF6461 domain-containing protein [Embleya hyalina]GCD97742.1 hypothetical protein EHYA_05438 [Embleya hyalina]
MSSRTPNSLERLFGEEACVTFSDSLSPADVLRVLGVEAEPPLPRTHAQFLDAAPHADTRILRVGSSGGWTFCQEFFGHTGLTDDHVSRLSTSGQALLFCWNREAQPTFAYACRGRVEAFFEPGMTAAPISSIDSPFTRRIRTLGTHRVGGLNDIYRAARETLSLDIQLSDIERDLPSLRIPR